jgi:hypothetical protein
LKNINWSENGGFLSVERRRYTSHVVKSHGMWIVPPTRRRTDTIQCSEQSGRLNNNNTSGLRRGRARLEVIIELTHKLFAITFLGFCPIDGTNISTVPNASISPVNPAGEPKSDSNSSLQHPAINFAPSGGPDGVQISYGLISHGANLVPLVWSNARCISQSHLHQATGFGSGTLRSFWGTRTAFFDTLSLKLCLAALFSVGLSIDNDARSSRRSLSLSAAVELCNALELESFKAVELLFRSAFSIDELILHFVET